MKAKATLLHFLLILVFSSTVLVESTGYARNISSQKARELSLFENYNKYPKKYGANIQLGYHYLVLGKYENSLFHYRKAAKAKPKDYSAFLGVADAYSFLGKYKKSIKIYKYLKEAYPKAKWGYLHLARLYIYLKNYSLAYAISREGLLKVVDRAELGKINIYAKKMMN